MSPFTVGILAILFLLFIPLLIGVGSFFILLKIWISKLLQDESVKTRLSLALQNEEITWAIKTQDIPWPAAQLEWAAAAALAAMLCGMVVVDRDLNLQFFWFVTGAATAVIAVSTPLFLSFFSRHKIYPLIERELVSSLDPRSAEEFSLMQEIGSLGNGIEDACSNLGLETRIRAADVCKEVLIRRAVGAIPDAANKFAAVRDSLGRFHAELRAWAQAHAYMRHEFELTKNLIMDNGSVTLLGEIDRVKALMTSEQLGRAVDRGQWDEAGLLIEQISFDLKIIRNMAEGGTDVPQSLGEACRILNVTKDTPTKKIKAVVDALRRVWHPDLSRDDEEREHRTIRIRQINTAWEIILAAEMTDEPLQGEEPTKKGGYLLPGLFS